MRFTEKELRMNNKFFDWKNFTPDLAAQRLAELLPAAENAVAELEQKCAATYEDLVWRINDATRELWRTWGALSHMMSVMNTDEWRKVQEEWQPKIIAFSLRVSQSPQLYKAAKTLVQNGKVEDSTRRRILEKMVEGAELAGVALEGDAKVRFNEIQAKLAKLGSDFVNAIIDATTPEISDANYPETMKHEPDRAKRERLYRLRCTRAPENGERINEILLLRREAARILGFDSFAEKSLKTKSAATVAAVREMIAKLDEATAAIAEREERELREGATTPLEPWDLAWEAERLRERKYAYSEEELKRSFKFDKVLDGLFNMCRFLFGIEVREIAGDAMPPVWHEDVRFFEVCEKGETIAHFYLDPFVRTGLKSGGAWMNEFRNRFDRDGLTPVAVIVLNLPLRDENGECLMPMREVETLFHEFGHALQCMLTRVGEEDAAGINLVEWDAVEVASQFMENWCLDDRTGIEVPQELKSKVRAARNYRAAAMCRRQLAFAKTDLDLHEAASVEDPNRVKEENFAHFGLPLIPEDRFLNAFSHIFAGGYAAGYYSYKWAEVMSADCYGAFEEAPIDNDEAVRTLGERYRETILAMGGSKSALEVFRRFRGRDPEITALLRQQGLEA
jgi:oligopeptidase A